MARGRPHPCVPLASRTAGGEAPHAAPAGRGRRVLPGRRTIRLCMGVVRRARGRERRLRAGRAVPAARRRPAEIHAGQHPGRLLRAAAHRKPARSDALGLSAREGVRRSARRRGPGRRQLHVRDGHDDPPLQEQVDPADHALVRRRAREISGHSRGGPRPRAQLDRACLRPSYAGQRSAAVPSVRARIAQLLPAQLRAERDAGALAATPAAAVRALRRRPSGQQHGQAAERPLSGRRRAPRSVFAFRPRRLALPDSAAAARETAERGRFQLRGRCAAEPGRARHPRDAERIARDGMRAGGRPSHETASVTHAGLFRVGRDMGGQRRGPRIALIAFGRSRHGARPFAAIPVDTRWPMQTLSKRVTRAPPPRPAAPSSARAHRPAQAGWPRARHRFRRAARVADEAAHPVNRSRWAPPRTPAPRPRPRPVSRHDAHFPPSRRRCRLRPDTRPLRVSRHVDRAPRRAVSPARRKSFHAERTRRCARACAPPYRGARQYRCGARLRSARRGSLRADRARRGPAGRAQPDVLRRVSRSDVRSQRNVLAQVARGGDTRRRRACLRQPRRLPVARAAARACPALHARHGKRERRACARVADATRSVEASRDARHRRRLRRAHARRAVGMARAARDCVRPAGRMRVEPAVLRNIAGARARHAAPRGHAARSVSRRGSAFLFERLPRMPSGKERAARAQELRRAPARRPNRAARGAVPRRQERPACRGGVELDDDQLDRRRAVLVA
ncbi:hypothetical protein BURPS1710b_A1816 [Burkholderia pseudomallei 1710b]|uniref:Uncharacterized protein n=1 Tax=Burkholderia pseudomallei (strain 1710b) TaxID=320372 RepID=Q3JHI0_BURP1|nr:hypothetical protein BURPS1710b_A1816 [Burkholderia pseudomallei 1710b]